MDKYLIENYDFETVDPTNKDKISCSIRIHDLIYLEYSNNYKHFYIRTVLEQPKGRPGIKKDSKKIFETMTIIPVVVKTESHVDDFMKAFRIEKVIKNPE
ncbi:hypothetical protein IT402_02280 [Candidatus Nomurabacteria bacterium]|nr:hypothetical protein [Candidatus Nomurabacteria bacterium]